MYTWDFSEDSASLGCVLLVSSYLLPGTISVYIVSSYSPLYLFRFDAKIAAAVAEETSLPFVTAENKFEALVHICVPLTRFCLFLC